MIIPNNAILINMNIIFIWIGKPNPCLRVAVGRSFFLDMRLFEKMIVFGQKLNIFVNIYLILSNTELSTFIFNCLCACSMEETVEPACAGVELALSAEDELVCLRRLWLELVMLRDAAFASLAGGLPLRSDAKKLKVAKEFAEQLSLKTKY